MTATIETNPEKPYVPAAVREGKWLKELRRRIICGEQAIEVVGTEPGAVLNAAAEGARLLGWPLISWDCASGFLSNDVPLESEVERLGAPPDEHDNPDGLDDPGLRSPLSALRAVVRFKLPAPSHALFVLSNFYCYFQDDLVRQEFENLCKWNLLSNRSVKRPVVFIQHPYAKMQLTGLDSVRHWAFAHPFPLPTAEEIRQEQVTEIQSSLPKSQEAGPNGDGETITEETLMNIAGACVGLERHKVTSSLYYAVSKFGGLNERVAREVRRTTAQQITEQYPFLELVHQENIMLPQELAGCRNIFGYVERAARRRTPLYRDWNCAPPKGMWLCGITGTGKTEVMKSASHIFTKVTGKPCQVIIVNVAGMLGEYVGVSEGNWLAFQTLSDQFPEDIFVFDECDKVLDVEGDTSGVRKAIRGMMLQWLNTRNRAFVALAMNSPAQLPPEMLRRCKPGFFFDLPKAPVREAILKIHFDRAFREARPLPEEKRSHAVLGFSVEEWATLGRETEGWIPDELRDLVDDVRDYEFVPSLNVVLDRIKANAGSIASVFKADDMRQIKELCKTAQPIDIPDEAGPDTSRVTARARMPRAQKRGLGEDNGGAPVGAN